MFNKATGALKYKITRLILGECSDQEILTPTGKHCANHSQTLKQMMKLPLDLLEVTKKLMLYAYENTKKNRITFFHGQGWGWNLRATLTKKLYEQKYGIKIGNTFYFLRFLLSDMCLCDDHQRELAQQGVRQISIWFNEERWNILFANLALFANSMGSNTVDYVKANTDQSIINGRNKKALLDIFKEYCFEQEIEKLQEQTSGLFENLEALHKAASKYGNFVAISMPKELASKIAYQTTSGGPRIEYKGMKDVVEIEENFEKMPYNNEYGIVLGPNILDPIEAEKAKVEVMECNAGDPEIIAKRDAVIDKIIAWCDAAKKKTKSESELKAWAQQIAADLKSAVEQHEDKA